MIFQDLTPKAPTGSEGRPKNCQGIGGEGDE